ncbi:hypothetical protein JCM8547_000211 [Rhodosporidiobolus lusitaniae]
MATHHGFLLEFPFIRIDAFDGDPAVVNPYTGQAPLFYLLSHAHTDHLVGLDSPHFSGTIYCTPQTRTLLLETQTAADRVRYEELGKAVGKRKKFANLQRKKTAVRGGTANGFDRIKEVRYNQPTVIPGPDGTSVTVTALDANHCPGSAMFLITGPSPSLSGRPATILHTGDVRAEDWWIEALRRNPLVQPYLAPPVEAGGQRRAGGLERVYLDTSSVLLDEELVQKDEATSALVSLMARYPPETRFFLNAWTWGYEDILKAVHRHFDEPIHLDAYKHKIYTSPSFSTYDPLLASHGTTSLYPPSSSSSSAALQPSPSLHAPATFEPFSTAAPSRPSSATSNGKGKGKSKTQEEPPNPPKPLRFHACERRWRCDVVWASGVGCFCWEVEHLPLLRGPKRLKTAGGAGEGEKVVFVNPAEMPRSRWEEYRVEVEERVGAWEREEKENREGKGRKGKRAKWKKEEKEEGEAKLPNSLIVPLSRHSSLPELLRLVSLFSPHSLTPLTLAQPLPPSHGVPAEKQHLGWDYLQLPSLFAEALAEGGEERVRREAKEHVKLLRRQMRARQRLSGVVSSAGGGGGEEEEDLGGLVEPKWVREMGRKGMNIEGGLEVVREVVGWSSGKWGKGEKEAKEKGGEEEQEVLVLDTDEEEEEEEAPRLLSSAAPSAAALSAPTSAYHRPPNKSYNDPRRAAELARRPSPFLDVFKPPPPPLASCSAAYTVPATAPGTSTTTLLPPASIHSNSTSICHSSPPPPSSRLSNPPAHAASSLRKRDRDRTPEPTLIPSTFTARTAATTASTGRTLRKSVTFAASPSPRQRLQKRRAASEEEVVKEEEEENGEEREREETCTVGSFLLDPDEGRKKRRRLAADEEQQEQERLGTALLPPLPLTTSISATEYATPAIFRFQHLSTSTSATASSSASSTVLTPTVLHPPPSSSSSSSSHPSLLPAPAPPPEQDPRMKNNKPRITSRPSGSPASRARRAAICKALRRGGGVGGAVAVVRKEKEEKENERTPRAGEKGEKGWPATTASPSSFRTVEASTSPYQWSTGVSGSGTA